MDFLGVEDGGEDLVFDIDKSQGLLSATCDAGSGDGGNSDGPYRELCPWP